MVYLEYFLLILYLWFGYKIFISNTYGSILYQIIIIVLSFTLYISSMLYLFTSNKYYLLYPLVPYLLYFYFDNKIKQKTKKLIYKKN
jgi:hypothetical protein